MTWEYLDFPEFMIRYILASGVINTYSPNQVVDLNCGKDADLWDYLNDDIGYFGNDILLKNLASTENGRIEILEDALVCKRLQELCVEVDCLACLGDGAGLYTGEKRESSTSQKTIRELIKTFDIKYFVYETVQRFEDKYGLFTQMEEFLLPLGYEIVYDLSLDIAKHKKLGFVSHRRMKVYTKE